MDPLRRDEYKQRLYELTPPDGQSITNAALRDALRAAIPGDEFSQEDYWDLRNSLIDDAKLERDAGAEGLYAGYLLPSRFHLSFQEVRPLPRPELPSQLSTSHFNEPFRTAMCPTMT